MTERKKDDDQTSAAHKSRYVVVVSIATFTLFLLLITLPLTAWSIHEYYDNKILPNVHVGSVSLGNLTKDEARQVLEQRSDTIEKEGIVLLYQNRQILLQDEVVSLDPDLSKDALDSLIDYDIDRTIESAYLVGRDVSSLSGLITTLRATLQSYPIKPHLTIDEILLSSALTRELSLLELPSNDARWDYHEDSNSFTITPESSGNQFNYERIRQEIQSSLEQFKSPRVSIALEKKEPSIKAREIEILIPKVQSLIKHSPLTLTFEGKEWSIDTSTIAQWLSVKPLEHDSSEIFLDKEAVIAYLTKAIAPSIAISATDPRFEWRDGRAVAFQQAKKGRDLDIKAVVAQIESALFDAGSTSIALHVNEIASPLSINPDSLSISELVAVGESQFKGSPPNRIKNIQVGAQKINGLLIAPDEEFSLIHALGEINGRTGFLPELVIKGNKTVPEYGGGLCQIGTTVFRAATFAGLPILERRNHSYSVPYYNPVGFDATIYDPKPDLKFKNDTGNYLLIQTRIEGTTLKIEFWGKKDGRQVTVEKPRVFNIKPAGAVKMIETDELKPGEKKCTEKAHAGMDAVFGRSITYSTGEIKKDEFRSHYIIWPAVCLVGKTIPSPQTDETVILPIESSASDQVKIIPPAITTEATPSP